MPEIDVVAPATPAAVASPKKTPKKASAKPKAKKTTNHPPTSEMVLSAIASLKEKGGSSLMAIKKYISGTYKIDVEKLSPFIKKYLKTAVASGSVVQAKGKGASGSFKLPAKGGSTDSAKVKAKPKVKKPVVEKKKTTKAVKKPVKKTKPVAKKTSEKKIKTPVEKKKEVAAKTKVAKPKVKKSPKPKKAKTATKAKRVSKK